MNRTLSVRNRPDIRTFNSISEVFSEGFVPAIDPGAKVPQVGQRAVVDARGDIRLGTVTKVTPKYVYVAVATPTSPDLFTTGKVSRLPHTYWASPDKVYFSWSDGFVERDPSSPICEALGEGESNRGDLRCCLTAGHLTDHLDPSRGYGGYTTWPAKWEVARCETRDPKYGRCVARDTLLHTDHRFTLTPRWATKEATR